MSRRLALILFVAVACAAGAVTLALAIGRRAPAGTAAGPGGLSGAVRPAGLPPARFRLRDENGHLRGPADYRGRVTVVTFLYTTCKDTCPLTAQQIAGAMDILGHRVPVLAVSVDPAHDTPRLARRFLAKQHVQGLMRFGLGDASALQPVWRQFGVAPQTRGAEHSVSVVLLDRQGRQRIGFGVDDLTPDNLAHDVGALERAG